METNHTTTDEQLAAQVPLVPEMYGFLIDRYQEKLDRYVWRKTGLGSDERADVVQDVFVKTYQSIESFDPSLSFNSWIYRICHNTIVNDWKKNIRYREGTSFDSDAGVFMENMMAENSVEHDMNALSDQKVITSALGKLKQKYQDILVLRFFEEKSYEEISDILQIPAGTVATNINRAKKSLAKQVELLSISPPTNT